MEEQIKCPNCGSTQIIANKKGFSGKKAVVGGLLVGGIGLLAGTHKSNNIKITCLSCNTSFSPGEDLVGGKAKRKEEMQKFADKMRKNEEIKKSLIYRILKTFTITLFVLFAIVLVIVFFFLK
jgi:predicted RNA-binding Zn-ribbon protein involved in translation (DUF1610 family)